MSDPVSRLNASLEGRYAIERELGEGGMATVYLADDLKHNRQVALKVLRPELAAVVGAERFLAEIETTANLTHPHILPLFDSGEADGFLFYVMPYLEGETLQDRIKREKQLPVDEAVRIAEPEILFPGTTPRYVAPGYVVYWREGALWLVPFDLEELQVIGPPTLVAQDVRVGTNGFAYFAVRENILIYQAGGLAGVGSGDPVWVDREGNQEMLAVDPGLYAWPRISPNGTKVVLARLQDNWDVWIHDLTTGVSTQLTFDPGRDYSPIWTPDGEYVVFHSSRDGPFNIYRRRADGTDEVERLTTSPADQRPHGFTPDGSTLLFAQVDSATGSDLWSISMEGGSTAVPLMREGFSETQPSISPNGRFIAYESSELGYPEIFVRSFPDPGGRRMISTLDIGPMSGITNSDPREARSPLWSLDGTELFYRSGNAVVRVPLGTERTFAAGTPEVLFEGPWVNPSQGRLYDVSSEGQRFLMIRFGGAGDDAATPNELVVVQNWFEELRERVGN